MEHLREHNPSGMCEDGGTFSGSRPDVVSFGRRKELMAMATKIAADLNAPAIKSHERHLLRRMVDLLLVDE